MKRQTKIWRDPPPLAMPNDPAFVTDCSNAWIAYETANDDEGVYAVVKFGGVIDLHLTPINDEGLGSHPYAKLGIRCYEFNELFDTAETRRWATIGGRQFAITFKDVTIDVIARTASVLATELRSVSANAALLIAIDHARPDSG
jgi:hypothetical protein